MLVYDGPAPSVPVLDVQMTDDEKTKLQSYLVDEHERALSERHDLELEWEDAVKQWNARNRRKDASTQDSDIDRPTTFKYGRVEAAQVMAPLFSVIDPDSFIVCKKKSKKLAVDVKNYQDIIDHIVDKSEYQKLASIMFRNAQVFSYCVVKAGWERDCETVFGFVDTEDPKFQVIQQEDKDSIVAVYKKQALVERTVTVREGCFPHVIPNIDYIFPWYAIDRRTSPWETHRVWLTKQEMQSRVDDGKFEQSALDALGDPESTRPKQYDVEQMSQGTARTNNLAGQSRHYELMETYLSWKCGDSKKPREVIALWERKQGKLLSVKYNWLSEYRRPFSVWSREERDDGIPGISLCYRLKYLHRAQTAILNIGLDAAARAATTTVFINTASDLMRHFPGNVMRPGVYPTTADPEKDIKQFRLSYDAVPLDGHAKDIESDARMVVGIDDTAFGKDVAQRPTATGTAKIMEASAMPIDVMRESFRKELAHIVKMQLARYKQFMPDGLYTFINSQDQYGQMADADILTWPEGTIEENIEVETRISSATINRDIKKQEALALVKQLPELINFMMQLGASAADVSNPAHLMALDALVLYATSADAMLREFGFSDASGKAMGFVADLQNGMQVAQLMQQAQQAIQQNQQLQQQNAALQQQTQGLGQQNETLSQGLADASGKATEALAANFHLRRALAGMSPGPVIGPGSAPPVAPVAYGGSGVAPADSGQMGGGT